MDAQRVERVWRDLLPPGTSFSVGFEPSSFELSAAERRSLPVAGALRTREFAAGRWHAKRALAELGFGVAELPRRADGSPAWPRGAVGSIAHTVHEGRVFVIAVAARADALCALGVDVEAPGRIEPHAWPAMLTPTELGQVLGLAAPRRAEAVRAIWCAKEAVAKASGVTGRLLDIEVALGPRGGFAAVVPDRPEMASRANLEPEYVGRSVGESGWVCAVATRFGKVARAAWP